MKAPNEEAQRLRSRTRQFALRSMRLVDALPRKLTAEVIGRQLTKSASSVGANYRAACRARSTADFIAKMGIVEEEADESGYWLELIREGGLVRPSRLVSLIKEADELVAIAVASIRTARKGSR